MVAIVTGATAGIGKAICSVLLENEIEVFGFGRDLKKIDELNKNPLFHGVEVDIMKTQEMERAIKQIKKEREINLLINNAGCAYYGLHEELNTKKIQEMVRVNLEAPMLLVNWLLRDLKKNKGTIINISSVTATKSSPHGCAYAATKAGLSSFSESIFDEARKYGVKVVDIKPDMTQTQLYRNADFGPAEDLSMSLAPEDVAEIVNQILHLREGLVIHEVIVKPQLHRIEKRLL